MVTVVATPEPDGPPSRNDESTTVRPAALALLPISVIEKSMKNEHPMLMKKQLAERLVDKVCGDGKGRFEREQFEKVFSKGDLPDKMPEFGWNGLSATPEAKIFDLMAATKIPAFTSKKECRRMIEQGAVKIIIEGNETKVSDVNHVLAKPEKPVVIQAGKRNFFKVLP